MGEYTEDQIRMFLKIADTIEAGRGIYNSEDAERLEDIGLVEIGGPMASGDTTSARQKYSIQSTTN